MHYHKTRHENSNLFYCADCQHFYKAASYSKHMERHNSMYFSCQVCKKSFTTLQSLISHTKIHSGKELRKKKFSCGQCKMKFRQKYSLQYHISKHANSNLIYCSECQRFYKTASYSKHMKHHNTSREYKCNVCNKILSSAASLWSHKKIHGGKFKFPCPACDKKFHQKGNLYTHIKSKHSS